MTSQDAEDMRQRLEEGLRAYYDPRRHEHIGKLLDALRAASDSGDRTEADRIAEQLREFIFGPEKDTPLDWSE